MRASLLVLVLAFVVFSTQLAQASSSPRPPGDPGISATTIKLGGVIDQSGPGTIASEPILGGYELAIRQINAEGGINGRTIEYTARDDGFDPAQTLPKLKQVVESDGAFAVMGIFGSDDSGVAAPYLENSHIPFFDPIGGGVNLKGKQWVWQTEPDFYREGKVIAKYAATTLRARRVALLYAVGLGEPELAALEATLPKYHAQFVGAATYTATDSNLSGQVIRVRGYNPDLVVLNGAPTSTAAFLQYARLLNFKPAIGYFADYPLSDPLWLALIGANGEGSYVSTYADLSGNNVVAAAYRAAIQRYNGDRYSNYGLYGYFNASLLFRALKLAGRNLTRASLQKVLDTKFRHYKTGFTGNLDWTPTQHYGARQFRIYKIHDGKFVSVTGWIAP
jgi:ABC-type branched-subunit amino acid transport system substrate-binding protein